MPAQCVQRKPGAILLKADWHEDERTSQLISAYKEVLIGGAYCNGEGGLKPNGWQGVADVFARMCGLAYTNSQLKNRWAVLKQQHGDVQYVRNLSGAGAYHPYLPEEAWNDLLERDDHYAWIRALPEEWTFLHEMEDAIGSKCVSGKNIRSADQVLASCMQTAYPYSTSNDATESVDDQMQTSQAMYREAMALAGKDLESPALSGNGDEVTPPSRRVKARLEVVPSSGKKGVDPVRESVRELMECSSANMKMKQAFIDQWAEWLQAELLKGTLSAQQVLAAQKFTAHWTATLMRMKEEVRLTLLLVEAGSKGV